MEFIIESNGEIRFLYDDDGLFVKELGVMSITRASHVEPTPEGMWAADLSPVGGPTLGPFARRAEALKAERDYIRILLKEVSCANTVKIV